MRVKAVIAYDGSKFFGFQRQTKEGRKRHTTVESRFEEALASLGIGEKIVGSGRTDRGVHATGQVISFLLPDYWKDLDQLKKQLNIKLLPEIAVRNIEKTDEGFHPRYSAKKRTYRYLIYNKEPSPFLGDYACFRQGVDLKKANEALGLFVGQHDFEFFRKTGSDEKDTVRTLYKAFAYRYKGFTVFSFEGDGFLRSQVRLMTASVFEYLDGKVELREIQEQLLKKSKKIKRPAIHTGLYLSKIRY